MDLQTKVQIPDYPFKLHVGDRVLLLGSCFANHIGAQLSKYKFDVFQNPQGIVFNPYAIANGLERCLTPEAGYDQGDLVFNDGLYHSFDHHSSFSNTTSEDVLTAISRYIGLGGKYVECAKMICITLGTAWVYFEKEGNRPVANCHKLPSTTFEKRRIEAAEIAARLKEVFVKLKERNPELHIVLTVSPVRHTRDGLIENQQSKSELILACDRLVSALEFVYYFPVYEMFIDEWRDYRFYEKDLIHPSDLAIQLVWTRFCSAFISMEENRLIRLLEKLHQSLSHRSRFPTSKSHVEFRDKLKKEVLDLASQYSHLDWSWEISHIE